MNIQTRKTTNAIFRGIIIIRYSISNSLFLPSPSWLYNAAGAGSQHPGNEKSQKTATKFYSDTANFPRAPGNQQDKPNVGKLGNICKGSLEFQRPRTQRARAPARKVIHRLSPVFCNWGVWEFVSTVDFQQILIRTSCLMYFDYLLVVPLLCLHFVS